MRKTSLSVALAGLALAAASAATSAQQFGAVMDTSRSRRGPAPPSPYYGGRKVKAQWKRERGMR